MRFRTLVIAAAGAAVLFSTSMPSFAQCTNLTASPPPTAEQYAANMVRLRYAMTGPGGGDDRPELYKSLFQAPLLGFDPQNLHTVHVTFSKNTIGGPQLWTASVPPSNTLWTMTTLNNGNIRWQYYDVNVTFGVRQIRIIEMVGGGYLITYLRGKNQSITNAPLLPGTDNVHVMVEIESAGVGVCYDGTTTACAGTGNTQKCYVF